MRFLDGLQDGDFAEGVDKNGRPVYYWAEHEHSEMKGKTNNTRLKRGRDDLTDADLSMGLKMFSSYSSFNFKHVGGAAKKSDTPALTGTDELHPDQASVARGSGDADPEQVWL